MQVKRYEAVNIQEALVQIKRDLGSDAIVLSTKKIDGKANSIEVIVARDLSEGDNIQIPYRDAEEERKVLFSGKEFFRHVRMGIDELKSLMRSNEKVTFRTEIAELKNTVQSFIDVVGFQGIQENETLMRIYHYLVGKGISKHRVHRVLNELKKDFSHIKINAYENGLVRAKELLSTLFTEAPGDNRGKRIKVLLGPTGVGKTTTLAKLAARYALEQKLTVGLITTDTYRIAAPEQLRTYARIMGVPMTVAGNKGQFQQSLERYAAMDIVLVDTPGQGGTDARCVAKLKDIIFREQQMEISLLLSLTSSRKHLIDAIGRFGVFDCDRIIITKMDECPQRGVVYDVLEYAKKPVSYVTTGQNVPMDIEEVNAPRLAELVMQQ
jgi:flagellar biosynthesis protein FlhF